MEEYIEIKKLVVEPGNDKDDPDWVKITESGTSDNGNYSSTFYGSRKTLTKRDLLPADTLADNFKYALRLLGIKI